LNEDQQRELSEVRFLLRKNRDLLKPYFGLMFWQLQEAEKRLGPEEFAKHGMSMSLEGETDEVLASFTAAYVKLWLSAGDFNAASRFIAAELSMTADELLQTRQFWLGNQS